MRTFNEEDKNQMYFGDIETGPGYEFVECLPPILLLRESILLFKAAIEEGILEQEETPAGVKLVPGMGITKGQLAYWCIKACKYLGLERGHTTYWVPFEQVFGHPAGPDPVTGVYRKASTPLKAFLHDIDFTIQDPTSGRPEYLQPIDNFFNNYAAR